MRYVLGFAFNDKEQVTLIEKLRPDFQKGLLNGIGGKIEGTESSREAMIREFSEETGVITLPNQWKYFGYLTFPEDAQISEIYLYAGKFDHSPKTVTDEKVGQYSYKIIHDLPMLKGTPTLISTARVALDQEISLVLDYL